MNHQSHTQLVSQTIGKISETLKRMREALDFGETKLIAYELCELRQKLESGCGFNANTSQNNVTNWSPEWLSLLDLILKHYENWADVPEIMDPYIVCWKAATKAYRELAEIERVEVR